MNFLTTLNRSETIETDRAWHAINGSKAIALLQSDGDRGLTADKLLSATAVFWQ